ncbi:MAG: protein kinase [Solirubrobacteraceae bacterium]
MPSPNPCAEAAEQRREILRLLERLHRYKHAAYGDAWRKRGEVIAIFANMARKYDRLRIAFDEDRPAATEALGDTVGDLCVYTAKYLTWIAEQPPGSISSCPPRPGLPMQQTTGTVGRYELLGELGAGGMAVVHLARQPGLDRLVALKELASFDRSDRELALRFLREAKVGGSLSHRSVVTVFDFFDHDGKPYIAMEYLPRGSLRAYVRQLTFAQVGGVLEGVLDGLGHAQRRGIVHRDLKPENLLVSSEGLIKIADFGIAKALDQIPGLTALKTQAGMVIGTPAYMAPEQADGREVGPWTDMYAVGLIAYELLTGQRPFADTAAPLVLMYQHANEPIPPAKSMNPTLDQRISNWVDQLLVKEPADRERSASVAWRQLEEVLADLLGPFWRRDSLLGEPPAASPSDQDAAAGSADTPAAAARGSSAIGPVPGPATPPPHNLPRGPMAPAAIDVPTGPPTPAPSPQATSPGVDAQRERAAYSDLSIMHGANKRERAAPERQAANSERAPGPKIDTKPPADRGTHAPPSAQARPRLWQQLSPRDVAGPAKSTFGLHQAQRRRRGAVDFAIPATDRSRRRTRSLLAALGAVIAAVIAIVVSTGGAGLSGIRVGRRPTAIAVGQGGVWVANNTDGTVSRIDPGTGKVAGNPIAVGNSPDAIAVGQGGVWVANNSDGTVSRIDPGTGKVAGNAIAVGNSPDAIAVAQGAVWVANANDNTVSRIDTSPT